MNAIDVFQSQISIVATITSMEASVLDLEHKSKANPGRVETYKPFIDGMNKHIQSLREALNTIRSMEKEITALHSSLYAVNKINLDLRFDNERLVKRNEELLKFI